MSRASPLPTFSYVFLLLIGVADAQNDIQFVVHYEVAPSCKGVPSFFPGQPLMPCGDDIQFFVVIAHCPVGADPGCWDNAPNACPTRPRMPDGGCLPALPGAGAGAAGTFTTAALSVPDLPSRHLLASVYYSSPSSPGGWNMELALAAHVPLTPSPSPAEHVVTLTPFFNALAAGSMQQIPRIDVPQFRGLHMAASVYLPPSCTENRAACPAAKIVVVTDGQPAQMPKALPMLLSHADALVMERRSRPLALLYVSSVLSFDNGTAWPCARGAMYTIGPCPNATNCGTVQCADTFGQADAFLRFVQETALPLVTDTFYGVGKGQKAGIVGFSYGGLVSCYAAWARPDVFDAAGCGSPSMWYPVYPQGKWNSGLNGTAFRAVMATFPAPVANAARLFVSDGTSEANCMGGSATHPGPIPLVVQAMRSAGMGALVFEQNEGYEHVELAGWFVNTLWRALSSIAPPFNDNN